MLGGGKFENGAMTGIFGYLFYNALHGAMDQSRFSVSTVEERQGHGDSFWQARYVYGDNDADVLLEKVTIYFDVRNSPGNVISQSQMDIW